MIKNWQKQWFRCVYQLVSVLILFYMRATLKTCKFIKIETLACVLSCECCKIFKNTCFTEHLWTTASEVAHPMRPITSPFPDTTSVLILIPSFFRYLG